MSDFQLVTGLSILISGFTQLDTGISAYHWQRLVQLAWFSSVTHLCCLTALRNYFRRNALGYFWRLPGMIILIIMLIVALIPTGHYTWESQTILYGAKNDDIIRPKPTDHAVCYFNHHEGRCTEDEWYEYTCEQVFQASQQRMILSAVFLAVGMCNRLWHLFRLPSRLYISARSFCSNLSTPVLSHMYRWSTTWSLWYSCPFILFAYYPALAALLTVRLMADMVTSRAFEVWWLIISFVWGLLNLWMRPTLHEDGIKTWTFGQVMALLVVFAPLITLVEGYVKGMFRCFVRSNSIEAMLTGEATTTQNFKSHDHMAEMVDGIEFIQMDSRAPSSLIGLVTKPTSKEEDFVNPHPSHDYYNSRFSFPVLVYSTLVTAAATSCLLLAALRTQDIRPSDIVSPGSTASFRFFLVPPIPVLIGYLGFCVLLSLVFEIRTPKGKAYRYWCRFLHFCLFTVILLLPSFSYTFVVYISMICAALYLANAVVHIVRRYKSKKHARKVVHDS